MHRPGLWWQVNVHQQHGRVLLATAKPFHYTSFINSFTTSSSIFRRKAAFNSSLTVHSSAFLPTCNKDHLPGSKYTYYVIKKLPTNTTECISSTDAVI